MLVSPVRFWPSARLAAPFSTGRRGIAGGSSSVVEHLLAKEKVAGSSPVFRSKPFTPSPYITYGPRETTANVRSAFLAGFLDCRLLMIDHTGTRRSRAVCTGLPALTRNSSSPDLEGSRRPYPGGPAPSGIDTGTLHSSLNAGLDASILLAPSAAAQQVVE